ncbi:type IV pilin protein [Kangiella koreensis]|uniref:General secretion pathway protein H n=1 Tax=Kangiella koreensis (strain DSM 16069 / JCM 12317 / KCTC 12182 / SW-125) TaxID=523791 RepID=C7RCS5_KANKD|nr:general secretion pathway protein H [Kangiella koreensis DSM 16069]
MLVLNRNKTKAFTLMEVMIVVAIVGILAAIAVPAYTEQIKKGKRNDAMQALLAASEAMERYKAANFSYDGAVLGNFFNTQVPVDGGAAYYTLSLEDLSATTYTIRAADTGSMEGDGDLTINQAGQKEYKGASGWPD